MKVKILKCSIPTYWYHDCIGMTFEVEKDDKNTYSVLDDKCSGRVILLEDAEIIEKEYEEEPFLTKVQFEKIFRICSFPKFDKDNYNASLKMAEKYIKKSKKQEMENFYNEYNVYEHITQKRFTELYNKAIAAIEEINNDKKE